MAKPETRLTAREGTIDLRIKANDSRVIGDSEDDLEFCRTIADVVRERGHYALLAPSAASQPGRVLAIYPENKPDRIQIHLAAPRLQLNYGPDPLIDELGQLRRSVPE